jgi:hypothetical protein
MWHVRRTVEKACKVLVENPEGIIPVGRSRRTWVDGSDIYVRETGMCAWNGLIWLMIGRNSGLL